MALTLPAIDQNICGLWHPQDVNLYNRLPVYFKKASAESRKNFSVWSKLLGTTPWETGQGDTMRRIMVEMAPVLRQNAYPNLISDRAKTDVYNVRERTTEMKIRWQKFVSPHFNWLPSYQDFLRGNIGPATENINRQVSLFEDQFDETHIWNWSPNMYICGVGAVLGCPQGDTEATGKSQGFIQQRLVDLAGAAGGTLTFEELWKAFTIFEEEIGATPYEGSGLPGGDSSPLNERYCLVQSPESWNNFQNDPWLKENRPLNLNIVTETFRGDLFGRIRSKLWRFPRRIQADDNFLPSYAAPETVQLNSGRDDFGRTFPNPPYATLQSQFEVAYLVGGDAYKRATSLSPPAPFNAGKEFQGMKWDGRAYLTDNFLLACKDDAGATYYEANSWGEFLRLQAALAMGIVGDNKFNIMPIIYKRHRGISTVLP